MKDDLNPDTRQLVELARKARTPGMDDKLRIAERLAVPLAIGAATGTVAATAKATGGLLSVGAKLVAVLAVGAAATGAIVTLRSKPSAPPVVSQPAVKSAPVVAPTALVISDTAPTPEPETSATPAHKPAPTHPPSAKPGSELAEEAALLHQAQTAWRAGQSAQALQLANQHAQRFPRSQLANERDVLRVLSLCKLGQAQAAKQVGARLLSRAKGSPWYQSVAESCAAK
jgi:hypothetical protein